MRAAWTGCGACTSGWTGRRSGAGAPGTSVSALIDWGDGTAPTPGTVQAAGPDFEVDGSHTYADEGSYGVSVMVAEAEHVWATAIGDFFKRAVA